MSARSRKDHQLAPFAEFEPLLSQLRQALDCSNDELMKHIGYAGASTISTWRTAEKVPVLAINGAKGLLTELGQKPAAPPVRTIRQFSLQELSRLFALCMGIDIPPEQKAALVQKLAAEMAKEV